MALATCPALLNRPPLVHLSRHSGSRDLAGVSLLPRMPALLDSQLSLSYLSDANFLVSGLCSLDFRLSVSENRKYVLRRSRVAAP